MFDLFDASLLCIISKNKAWIGYLEAAEGIAQFVTAALTGAIADRSSIARQQQQHNSSSSSSSWILIHFGRRDSLLRVSSVIGLVASGVTFGSAYYRAATNVWWWALVGAAPVLWGVFDGINLTANLSLFADSIPDGARSYYLTRRTMATTIGQLFGPLSALVMFLVLGDQWSVSACGTVICYAQFFLIPAYILCWFFSDDDIPPLAAAIASSQSPPISSSISNNTNNHDIVTIDRQLDRSWDEGQEGEEEREHFLMELDEEATSSTSVATTAAAATTTIATNGGVLVLGGYTISNTTKERIIAIGSACSDVLCALAQGLSLRYFALFLLDDMQLHPVMVQILDAISCIMSSFLLWFAQKLTTITTTTNTNTTTDNNNGGCGRGFLSFLKFGNGRRCPIAIILKLIGVGWLIVMIVVPTSSTSASTVASTATITIRTGIVCLAYVMQTSFLTSTQALTRSLVMDNVPVTERSKWSALESINIFGWCGSAAIGGLLIEHVFDGQLKPVFVLTAVFQIVGVTPLIPVLFLEQSEQQQQ